MSSPGDAEDLRARPSKLPDGAKDVLVRTMLRRPIGLEMIGLIFEIGDNRVRDFAVRLDEPCPPNRKIRISADALLAAGTLAPCEPLRLFTPSQLWYLVASWMSTVPVEAMAETLGRSVASVKRKARALGLLMRQRQKLLSEMAETRTPAPAPRTVWRESDFEPHAGFAPPKVEAAAAVFEPATPAQPVLATRTSTRSRSVVPWTAERTKTLCVAWLEGLRPSSIAARLGVSALSVSTRAHRASLPARTRTRDGQLVVQAPGHICFDAEYDEYFWSSRRTAQRSAYRIARTA